MNKYVEFGPPIGMMLFGIFGLIHLYRYDLGLTKPKFSVGNCIARSLSNEFEKKTYDYNVIVKVGKKDYLAVEYDNDTGVGFFEHAPGIEYTDKDYFKVECPDRIKKIMEDNKP